MALNKEFPRTPPERRAAYVYGHKLHAWFAVASALLLIAVLGMIWQDYDREWKVYQRKFWDMKKERFEQDYREHYYKVAEKAKSLREQEQAASEALKGIEGTLKEQEAALATLHAKDLYAAKQDQKFAKAELDTALFKYEEARKRVGVGDPEGYKAEKDHYERLLADFQAKDAELKRVEARGRELQKEIDRARASVAELRVKRDELTRDRDNTYRNLSKMQPSVANVIRDAPMLDFIDPNLKIQQLVINDIKLDYYFAEVPLVDRCQTCHLGITDAHWDPHTTDQPFSAHPRLDLFLSGTSPHPVETFGCTVCHRGRPPATEFVYATHTPDDHAEEQRWKDKYHWESDHWWHRPMLASKFTQASCLKCHADAVELPGAERLMRGKRLFRDFGCYGCHKATNMEDVTVGGRLPQRGPSLTKLAGKIPSKDWAYWWVWDPKQFRPSTRMPRFFGQDNNRLDEKREQTEVAAMLEYLWTLSERPEYAAVRGGSVERGKAVVETVGCLACHRVTDEPEADGRHLTERVAGTAERNHGPELSRVGAKTTPEWIAAWLQNPQAHSKGTRMPDLRLSDQERADVATYLATLTGGYAAPPRPALDGAEVDALLLAFLTESMPPEAAAKELLGFKFDDPQFAGDPRLANLTVDQHKLMKVGQLSLRKYGCMGCHEIEGFAKDGKIGTDLYKQGSKPLTKLDFGLLGMHHGYEEIKPGTTDANGNPLPEGVHITLHDFMVRKLLNPRVYDWGKTKAPKDRLKMPNFEMTQEEAECIVTFILGMTTDPMPLERMAGAQRDDPVANAHSHRYKAEQSGWWVIREHNCIGCHRFQDEKLEFRQRRPENGETDHRFTTLVRGFETPDDPTDDIYAKDRNVTIRGVTVAEEGDTITFQLRSPHEFLVRPPDKDGKRELYQISSKLEFSRAEDLVRPIDPHIGEGIADAYLDVRRRRDGKPNLTRTEIANDLPPRLVDEGLKVQPPWVFNFLRNVNSVGTIRPWLEIRMPQFRFADGEAEAVAHFFAVKAWGEQVARLDYAANANKALKSRADRLPDSKNAQRQAWLDTVEQMDAWLNGEPGRYGRRSHFAEAYPFERYEERTAEYKAAREAELNALGAGRYFDRAWMLTQHKDIRCFKCHFLNGKAPEGQKADWAPDLSRARDRLRPQWMEWWITAPSKVLPGTKMPDFDWGLYAGILPGEDRDRVRALKDLLMNLDQIPQAK